jgi:hypothetical protein
MSLLFFSTLLQLSLASTTLESRYLELEDNLTEHPVALNTLKDIYVQNILMEDRSRFPLDRVLDKVNEIIQVIPAIEIESEKLTNLCDFLSDALIAPVFNKSELFKSLVPMTSDDDQSYDAYKIRRAASDLFNLLFSKIVKFISFYQQNPKNEMKSILEQIQQILFCLLASVRKTAVNDYPVKEDVETIYNLILKKQEVDYDELERICFIYNGRVRYEGPIGYIQNVFRVSAAIAVSIDYIDRRAKENLRKELKKTYEWNTMSFVSVQDLTPEEMNEMFGHFSGRFGGM